jgi:hypothetical protein
MAKKIIKFGIALMIVNPILIVAIWVLLIAIGR